MEVLTKDTFKSKIFDYEANKDWVFNGELPCIVDFYAEWCGPCKMIAPLLDELSQEYSGKISIYKVNIDEQSELAYQLGISSVPSILFVPKNDQPQMAVGAMPKVSFVNAIKTVLHVE